MNEMFKMYRRYRLSVAFGWGLYCDFHKGIAKRASRDRRTARSWWDEVEVSDCGSVSGSRSQLQLLFVDAVGKLWTVVCFFFGAFISTRRASRETRVQKKATDLGGDDNPLKGCRIFNI